MKVFDNSIWRRSLRLSALVLGLMTFTACEEVLDEDPVTNLEVEDALQTESGVEGLITGMYSLAGQGQAYGTNWIMVPDLMAGDIDWYGTFRGYIELYSRNILITNGEAERSWNHSYRIISHANRVLENSSRIRSTSRRAIAEGEARFFRALSYFYLVRFYSQQYNPATAGNPNTGVPLVLTALPFGTDPQSVPKPARATLQAVFNQILADLNQAKTQLPTSTVLSRDLFQRVNRNAASALLARIHLEMGNYAAAATEAGLVIGSGNYALTANTIDAFLNDNSSESIYEIQQNDQNNAGTTNDGLATFYVSRGEAFAFPSDVAFIYNIPGDTRLNTTVDVDGFVFKWSDPQRNYLVIRLAEMYLIRAEALLRPLNAGDPTPAQALSDLNQIRTRSNLPALATDNAGIILGQVMQERRRELFLEGHHFYDLRRQGLPITLGNGQTINAAQFTLPIPQLEVQLSGIVQNPLYQ